MKRKLFRLTACLLLLAACRAAPAQPVTRTEAGLLDTVVTFTIYGTHAQQALDNIVARTEELHAMMTVHEESPVSRLNQNGGGEPPPEVYELIKTALEYSRLTEGAFDITVRPLTRLWGIGTGQERVPEPDEIDAARKLVGFDRISLDARVQTVALDAGTEIDMGAIAKGYVCDQAVAILKEHEIPHALLDFGGNIYAHGSKPDGSEWKIGIRSPIIGDDKTYFAILPVMDMAVVTSGPYERFFMNESEVYHHIFDPGTGFPAQSGLLSVTIIAPEATEADVLSTACFVLGKEKGIALIESMETAEAVFVTEDLQVFATGELADRLTITDERFTLVSEQ